MNAKRKFEIVYLPEAMEFLKSIEYKARDKVLYNIEVVSYKIDPELFKKLTKDIWEFRTLYNDKQYRLLAFWDKTKNVETLVIATHGFIKKTDKIPVKELERANNIMKGYFK